MRRRIEWLLAGTAAMGVLLAATRNAASQDAAPTLDTILRAWQERQDRAHSFTFEWEQREQWATTGQDFLQRGRLDIDGDRVNYQFEREKQQLASVRQVYIGDELRKLTGFQGGSPHGVVRSRVQDDSLRDVDLIPMLMTYRAMLPAISSLSREHCTLLEQRGNIGGRECLIVECRASDDSPARLYWVDPALNYVVVRFAEGIHGEEYLREDIQYRRDPRYGPVPGEWRVVYLPEKGSLAMSKTYRMTRYEFNEPIAPERFELAFPRGTRVSDQVANRRYVEGSTRHFLQPNEPQRGLASYWPWLLLPAVVGIAGAVFWYVARHKTSAGSR